tara:strand:+ start:2777 stop:3349 length:573 start_codon:yes stop_codon:yes gene_type:complete
VSQTESIPSQTNKGNEITFPLNEFYSLAKRPLPAISPVNALNVPEPYKSLLVHERDMTSTLGQFHNDKIQLNVLNQLKQDDEYYREVLLVTKQNHRPVEYGAIKIFLQQFPEPARKAIVEATAPLGQLLHDYNINYLSKPKNFITIECDDYIGNLLGCKNQPKLFGRRNSLYEADNLLHIAEIVEILPIS